MADTISMYDLLPEVYRREDARRGYPLKALLNIISEQATVIKEDIDRLRDNFFVETADDWVLPYLGDLIGNIPLHAVVRGRRADIAKTISYRLRKGTLPMLEEMARDVTGWSVHAVAFFDILAWTQNVNHLRRKVGMLDVRDIDLCDRVHTPFDTASHTVDIRPFAPASGWHHIPRVGFFIWRLGSYELRDVQPRPSDENGYGYYFNPLGVVQPLFHSPIDESDDDEFTDEIHIAQPIRRITFNAKPEIYFGDNASIGIRINNIPQTATDIACMDLTQWRQRTDGKIGVDVVNGRLSLPSDLMGNLNIKVSLHYGFSGDLGGGTYERRDDPTVRDPHKWVFINPEKPGLLLEVPGHHDTIQAALNAWNPETHPRLLIQVMDSRTYTEPLIFNQNTENRENVQIVIQAENKQRPMIIGDCTVPETNNPTRLSIKGLLIEGRIRVETPKDITVNRGLDVLEVLHSTLVPGIHLDADTTPQKPGTPSILVGRDNDSLQVRIEHCIVGPLRLPPDMRSLKIRDSIVDNMKPIAMGRVFPAIASGNLDLADAAAAVGVPLTFSMGSETHTVSLSSEPTTPDEIALCLESALRSVDGATSAFTEARVLGLSDINRTIILQNCQRRMRIEDGEAAALLRLDSTNAIELNVFVGTTIGDITTLTQAPQLAVIKETIIDESLEIEQFDVTLSGVPSNGDAAAVDLQTLLNEQSELTDVFVRFDNGQLIIYSMQAGVTLRFAATVADPLGVVVLGLLSCLPAIGYDVAGVVPGPESHIENSTIMGSVAVRELQMASNSIFTGIVTVWRQQIGCVRFSYIPPASETPRRFRCQPDRSMDGAETDEMEPSAAGNARRDTGQRVRPEFVAPRYGLPAYAQLSQDCGSEILTGADNGSQMGVFNSLMQPQREANLRIRFQEYLPFGLEYGLIYVN